MLISASLGVSCKYSLLVEIPIRVVKQSSSVLGSSKIVFSMFVISSEVFFRGLPGSSSTWTKISSAESGENKIKSIKVKAPNRLSINVRMKAPTTG